MRDNLRHSSIAMTSVYLHGDEVKHARQIREAFSDQKTLSTTSFHLSMISSNCMAKMLAIGFCAYLGSTPS